ncbi:bifunctional aldolase/short-chain dehydrogenase [Candidatus Planktophila versatilis]|uniref:bifunctional aldolase/short-chain dehydrogenase n=1 Tax=Candidatus Planktophila versatilis TaxID=1884905 RepID=UPI001CBD8A17|nr:bifunctional aldolase/short-chain dehydrogenase [Candidatus Planktophila versatilis]
MGCIIKKLSELTPAVNELISRSNRLGADPKVTNYAGGNTSAKATITDPISGKPTSLIFVKGSGGDLGTLKEEGIAVLYTDKVHELKNVYPGEQREDEMVALFDYCLFGKGGAAPSIDTSMHGLVDKLHVDHLHPDSIIAFATSADGPAITKKCFGDEILWVDWRRPGFQLGLDIAKIAAENPNAKGCILGGHGLTTWADTSDECEKRSLDAIKKAEDFIKANGKSEPFGASIAKYKALAEAERRARAAQLSPILRGVASQDARMVGHFTDSDVVLDFIASQSLQKLAALGTSCPDHFLRTKVSPMVLDTEPGADLEQVTARIRTLHEEYRASYSAYYNRHATKESPAIRGADPLIILVPGIGMFSYGKDKQTARVAGEFYVNAINVMRGAEALSTYAPISELEKFRIEYWDLEEAKLRRMPKPKALAGQIAIVTGGASGIGRAIVQRYFDEGACVAIADRDLEGAKKLIAEMGNSERLLAVGVDVTLEDQVAAAVNATTLAFGGIDILVNNAGLSLSKSLVDTTVSDWDLQHNVMARGSFLFSREVAKAMIVQKMAGNILYIASKNAVFAGPNNVAYGATKADQAHQVRLLAAELGEYGIRVNGINPDGVVQGSGIFASGWGANRAAVYGVEEEKLGAFYAQRSILKLEVLPSHIAAAAFAFVAGDLPLTTGSHIPVDSGVASAFLR